MTAPLSLGEFFAGTGMFGLAGQWLGYTHAWAVEKEEALHPTLAQLYTTIYGDINRVRAKHLSRPDVVTCGFPCQDISAANPEGKGIEGARSREVFRAIKLVRGLRPRYFVLENSPRLTVRGLHVLLGALASIGYDAEWDVFSAGEFGANHKRRRIIVVAYPHRKRGNVPPVFTPEFAKTARAQAESAVHLSAKACGVPVRIQPSAVAQYGVLADGHPYWLAEAYVKAAGNAVHPAQAVFALSCIQQHHQAIS